MKLLLINSRKLFLNSFKPLSRWPGVTRRPSLPHPAPLYHLTTILNFCYHKMTISLILRSQDNLLRNNRLKSINTTVDVSISSSSNVHIIIEISLNISWYELCLAVEAPLWQQIPSWRSTSAVSLSISALLAFNRLSHKGGDWASYSGFVSLETVFYDFFAVLLVFYIQITNPA